MNRPSSYYSILENNDSDTIIVDSSSRDFANVNASKGDKIPSNNYNRVEKRPFWKRVCFARKFFSWVLFFSIWIAVYIVSYPDVDNNLIYTISGTTPFKIVLFGDSFINVGCLYFNLAEKLQHQFPHYPLQIINAGVNNNRIADLKARMYRDVVNVHPDGVIIYWDSDVSDQLVDVLQESTTQQQYKSNCVSVFTTCQNASQFIAVAGPSILSEGPIFPRDQYDSYQYKYDVLNQYREINRNISETFHIEYIDLRGALQAALPSSWLLARWFVTSDGEHENERGARILAREFGKVLNAWLNELNSG